MKAPSMQTITFSVRTTPETHARLRKAAEAAGMGLSPYMIWRSLDPTAPRPVSKRRVVIEDQHALAHVLALLGASRIASNLNQLARAANSGSLTDDPDTIGKLNEAVEHVASMRHDLIVALGLSDSP